jgi:polysaccharide export outer membrane protein
MKHASQTQSSHFALAYLVKACLVVLGLLPGAVGCETMETPETPGLSQIAPAAAQTRPLTPEEWLQRNFPRPDGTAAGQNANSPPQTEMPTPAANPAAQASPPAQAPAPPPVLLAQASPPAQAPASPPEPAAQASPPASPPASLPASPPPMQVDQTNLPAGQPASRGPQPNKPEPLLLREGDSVRISFPGAPTLNTVQQIRRDGKVTLQLVGEFKAAGITPSQAEKELIQLYSPHLQVKEVTVAVESSVFAVYVTGAVLRPGKIMSDRPISAMEAVVEAGIDYAKANLKKVRVIRQENGRSEYHILNLRQALLGSQAEPFDLRPSDIIYVPERFTWF